ncbi:MAG: hypothetical protein R3Y12_02540 [Clostridia bacterium]
MIKNITIKSEIKQFISIIYTIMIMYLTIIISKNYSFSKYNWYIFLTFYAIIGFIIPTCINFKNLRPTENKIDKNLRAFTINFSIGYALILEVIIYYLYQNKYREIVENSLILNLEFNIITNIFVVLVFIVIVCIYYMNAIQVLQQKYSGTSCIVACVLAFAITYDNNTLKNVFLGVAIFYFLSSFSQIKMAIALLSASTLAGFVLESLYRSYANFGIMHYFVFIYVVIGFIFLIKAIKIMETVVLYYRFNQKKIKRITSKELEIIWFSVLLLGIFIATYNGRF